MKKICLLLAVLLVFSSNLIIPKNVSAATEWGSWQNATTSTFDGKVGNWSWDGNTYEAYHHLAANKQAGLVSWTDFGTGLGENLTNYKVKFKAVRVPDGQGTPGFITVGRSIETKIVSATTYQATAKGFGVPVCYFGDWVNHKYAPLATPYMEWSQLGNPAINSELLFEITVTPTLFKVTINGYTLDEVVNPPSEGKGYFGLTTEHTNLAVNTPVVFTDIQYMLPKAAAATTTPVPTKKPTSTPGPTNTVAPTVTPTSDSTSSTTSSESGSQSQSSSISEIETSTETSSLTSSDENSSSSESTESNPDEPKTKNSAVPIIVLVVALLAIGAGVVIYIRSKKTK